MLVIDVFVKDEYDAQQYYYNRDGVNPMESAAPPLHGGQPYPTYGAGGVYGVHGQQGKPRRSLNAR
jgi:hypothetical protein